MNELNHGNGKGSADRSPGWRKNYDAVDWQRGAPKPDGFRRHSTGKRKYYRSQVVVDEVSLPETPPG